MFKEILQLDGLTILNKEQQRHISGGVTLPPPGGGGEICKATCNDGSLVTVSDCANAAIACSTADGKKSCKCDYKSPLNP